MNNFEKIKNEDMGLDKNKLWEKCLLYIKEKIQEQAFQTWFDGVSVISINNEEITLQVPNQFHYEWLESKYRHLIDSALKEFWPHPLMVNYSVVISEKTIETIPNLTKKDQPVPQSYHRKSQLNYRYIFENFIEGKSNQFARAAAISVAENPAHTPYNPLLIYSSPGLGKTHLLQAIGNKIIRQNPNMKVVYLTSEKFMLDFISSIQKNNSTNFINHYRNIDMLLLDDAQFFQSKEQTQEQFFHLFNDLFQKGKQIVLTTDRHPNELKGLKERLVSRFQSGLIVDIQSPDLETRIAILMKKGESDGLEIPFDVIEFIASSIKGDIRAMEGVLVKLLALSSLRREDITINLAKYVLKTIMGDISFVNVSIKQIINFVCKEMNVSERQLLGKSRIMQVALARQIVMYFCKELTDTSLSNIGLNIGKRDHSTVVHSYKNIERKIKEDAAFKLKMKNMKSKLQNN